MTISTAIILGIVEGITEFLPISSTGHMILASSLLGIAENDEFTKTFQVAIQLGAIVAIAFMYIQRFFAGFALYRLLLIAFLPSAMLGFVAHDFIKEVLFNPLVVSAALIAGGVVLIIVDKVVHGRLSVCNDLSQMNSKTAFLIGIAQCAAMIPGVSRAGATIVGGVFAGLDKKQATEFSFLLAVPTMVAAGGYDLLKMPVFPTPNQWFFLIVGSVTAAIVAWGIVKVFIHLVDRMGFTPFGWYRIIVGSIFFLYIIYL